MRVLGAGGFGITYLAFDHQLDGPVALKEYFPAQLATRVDGERVAATATTNQETFAWGLERFLDEARAIHRLRHPNVVRANRYLEANGTAYIVMEYVEGESLKALLDRRGTLSPDEWRPWLEALMDGLAHVHGHGYLHRDIKPANIVVRAEDGEPVLIDFGAARVQHRDRTHTQVLTAGYAPIEQYSTGATQGPPADIYALAAVSYRVLTGDAVPSAPDRMLNDDCEPLSERIGEADANTLTAIEHGLAVRPEHRPQDVGAWRRNLSSATVSPAADIAAAATGLKTPLPETPGPSARTGAGTPSHSTGGEALPSRQTPPPRRPRRHLWWAVPALAGFLIVSLRLANGPPSVGDSLRDSLLSGGRGPELAVIPAGRFRMGCDSGVECHDDELPVHSVTIPAPLAAAKYEVTFSEWDACVESGGCRHVPDDRGWGRGNRPVVNVSWEDTQEYVAWLSAESGFEYRLLSESEWEYAARAGTSTAYSWGNEIGRNRANCDGCGSPWDNDRTAPVGSFGANPFGLHDMHGNVWEWVEDCSKARASYVGAPSDGSAWRRGDCSYRVLRGGSLGGKPRFLRSAFRLEGRTGARNNYLGFRVARTLTP